MQISRTESTNAPELAVLLWGLSASRLCKLICELSAESRPHRNVVVLKPLFFCRSLWANMSIQTTNIFTKYAPHMM